MNKDNKSLLTILSRFGPLDYALVTQVFGSAGSFLTHSPLCGYISSGLTAAVLLGSCLRYFYSQRKTAESLTTFLMKHEVNERLEKILELAKTEKRESDFKMNIYSWNLQNYSLSSIIKGDKHSTHDKSFNLLDFVLEERDRITSLYLSDEIDENLFNYFSDLFDKEVKTILSDRTLMHNYCVRDTQSVLKYYIDVHSHPFIEDPNGGALGISHADFNVSVRVNNIIKPTDCLSIIILPYTKGHSVCVFYKPHRIHQDYFEANKKLLISESLFHGTSAMAYIKANTEIEKIDPTDKSSFNQTALKTYSRHFTLCYNQLKLDVAYVKYPFEKNELYTALKKFVK